MSAPFNTLSPAQQQQDDDSAQKKRNIAIIYAVVIRVIAIVILIVCKHYAPNATPADFWTFLGILIFPELYILYKLYKWITGAQCSTKAESDYIRKMRAKFAIE